MSGKLRHFLQFLLAGALLYGIVVQAQQPFAYDLKVGSSDDTTLTFGRLADAEAGQRAGKVAAGLVDFGRGLADRDGSVLRDLRKLLSTDLGIVLVAHPTIVTETDADGADTERLYARIDANDRIRQCQKEIEKQEAVVRFMQENPGLQDKIDALNKLFF